MSFINILFRASSFIVVSCILLFSFTSIQSPTAFAEEKGTETEIECSENCPLYQEGVLYQEPATSNKSDNQNSEPLNTLVIIGLFTALGGIVMSIPCILVGAISLSKGNQSPALILILIGPIIFSIGASVVIILS